MNAGSGSVASDHITCFDGVTIPGGTSSGAMMGGRRVHANGRGGEATGGGMGGGNRRLHDPISNYINRGRTADNETHVHPWILPPELRLAPRVDVWFAFAVACCAAVACVGGLHVG